MTSIKPIRPHGRFQVATPETSTDTVIRPQKGRGKPAIDDLRAHASKRGGKCLALEYTDSLTKIPWQCAKGHVWISHWNSVQYHWCPKCAKIQKLELKEFVRIARQRGGKLLSTEYVNANTPPAVALRKRTHVVGKATPDQRRLVNTDTDG